MDASKALTNVVWHCLRAPVIHTCSFATHCKTHCRISEAGIKQLWHHVSCVAHCQGTDTPVPALDHEGIAWRHQRAIQDAQILFDSKVQHGQAKPFGLRQRTANLFNPWLVGVGHHPIQQHQLAQRVLHILSILHVTLTAVRGMLSSFNLHWPSCYIPCSAKSHVWAEWELPQAKVDSTTMLEVSKATVLPKGRIEA